MEERTCVSVLVVSWNTRELTLACLASALAELPETGEIIVVDNASDDGSAEAIASDFPGVKLIRPGKNLGFGAATNLGAEAARGEYLLLLNPDTIVQSGAIRELLEFAHRRPLCGIWGGRTTFADGSLNPASCWRRPTPWSLACTALGLVKLAPASPWLNAEAYGGWQRDREQNVDIVSGCWMLVRRSAWQGLGGFDPAFFMYGEDADLCIRARRLGYTPAVTPRAQIVHIGGASERVRSDKMVRLLAAKSLLIGHHWPPARRGMGRSLLRLWAASRVAGHGILRVIRPGSRPEWRAWREVWARRAEWVNPEGRLTCVRPLPISTAMADKQGQRVLAISSGGGHWTQLLRLAPALEGHDVTFVTVSRDYSADVPGRRFYAVNDATRWNKLSLLVLAARVLWILLWVRPHVVVSTGAAPGYFAVRMGKLLGARTVWLDSLANVEELSLSGRKAGRFSDLWLTQWPHLAGECGPRWAGAVL
jgi:N-acetylglucosaminyl-diphospho-decaprenol L-rhamnosyltransferase